LNVELAGTPELGSGACGKRVSRVELNTFLIQNSKFTTQNS